MIKKAHVAIKTKYLTQIRERWTYRGCRWKRAWRAWAWRRRRAAVTPRPAPRRRPTSPRSARLTSSGATPNPRNYSRWSIRRPIPLPTVAGTAPIYRGNFSVFFLYLRWFYEVRFFLGLRAMPLIYQIFISIICWVIIGTGKDFAFCDLCGWFE